MVLRSFAKINLSLLINRKLKNGFHDIQSLFCLIDLKDRIIIKKIKNKKIEVLPLVGIKSLSKAHTQNMLINPITLWERFYKLWENIKLLHTIIQS